MDAAAGGRVGDEEELGVGITEVSLVAGAGSARSGWCRSAHAYRLSHELVDAAGALVNPFELGTRFREEQDENSRATGTRPL